MSKNQFMNPDYKPDDNTRQEIEKLHNDGVSLSGIHLKYADMKNAKLVNVDMSGADLTRSDFSYASMYGANLEGANLFKANLEGANLKSANLCNCDLLGADFSNAQLNNVEWGTDYKIINEQEAEIALAEGNHKKSKEKYREAEDIYRHIKISLQAQTLGDDTGKIFIREMVARRKQFKKFSAPRIGSKIIELTTGYGEKLRNIVFTIIGVIIICMLLYGIEGISYNDKIVGFFSEDYGLLSTLGNLLYFSVVVYSTVGFGEMLPIGPIGKTVMMFEGIAGGLVLAILIIALYKKTMDR